MNKEKISKRIQDALKYDFVSVNESKNPIAKNLELLSYRQKLEVLSQYSIFPKNIISMLVSATYALSYFSWKNVVEELTQNISEEMGLGEGQIAKFQLPHYTILRKVFMECFELDINLAYPNASTLLFIENVKEVFNHSDPEFVCGGVYALESSAIPELSMVKKMALFTLQDVQKKAPELMIDFFDWHVNAIEIAHRDRLLDMVGRHIQKKKGWLAFENGFREVMTIMDAWWTQLAMEVIHTKDSTQGILIDSSF